MPFSVWPFQAFIRTMFSNFQFSNGARSTFFFLRETSAAMASFDSKYMCSDLWSLSHFPRGKTLNGLPISGCNNSICRRRDRDYWLHTCLLSAPRETNFAPRVSSSPYTAVTVAIHPCLPLFIRFIYPLSSPQPSLPLFTLLEWQL